MFRTAYYTIYLPHYIMSMLFYWFFGLRFRKWSSNLRRPLHASRNQCPAVCHYSLHLSQATVDEVNQWAYRFEERLKYIEESKPVSPLAVEDVTDFVSPAGDFVIFLGFFLLHSSLSAIGSVMNTDQLKSYHVIMYGK